MADFNPDEFVWKLDKGVFDGRLIETFRSLTLEQLKRVEAVLAARLERDRE